jgi:hypothetical protein
VAVCRKLEKKKSVEKLILKPATTAGFTAGTTEVTWRLETQIDISRTQEGFLAIIVKNKGVSISEIFFQMSKINKEFSVKHPFV